MRCTSIKLSPFSSCAVVFFPHTTRAIFSFPIEISVNERNEIEIRRKKTNLMKLKKVVRN